MNLARCVEVWAAQRPGAVALHFEGEDLTYGALQREVLAATRALHAHGVRRGDRVAFLGFNHPHMLALLFALARIGAILAPLNFRLAAAEHVEQLDDCSPHLLIHEHAFADHVRSLAGRIGPTRFVGLESEWLPEVARAAAAGGECPGDGALDDDCLLVYTSGTTGRPKGAVLTQNALLWNCVNSIHAHDLTRDDHVLIALPMFHVGGLNIMLLPALYVGARATIHRRFDAGAFLAAVAARRPTLTLLVPATIAAAVSHPDWAGADLSSLRMVNTGSSVVPVSLIEAIHARGIPAGQVYGSTETGPIAICLRAEDAMRKAGSAGLPAMHCEAIVADREGRELPPGEVGEIRVRGPNLMRCYFGRPEETRAAIDDGWYLTGDLGRRDEEGFFWVVGRSKDMIISGGENVYPAELESILADCPDVAEAAVIGLPDARWGELPAAVIVRREGSALDEAGVLRLFEGQLARYKHPRRVIFVDALPKTALGKPKKSDLVERFAGDCARE